MARARRQLTVEEIVDRLAYPREGRLPREALEEALARPGEITPFLLAEVSRTPEEVAARMDTAAGGTSYYMWDFAMLLLGAFREPRALAPILSFFKGPAKLVDQVAGYLTTEELPHVISRCYDGDFAQLASLATEANADDFARDAALRALTLLVIDKRVPREQATAFYLDRLEALRRPETGFFGALLVNNAARHRAPELKPAIEAWIDAELVEETFIDRQGIEAILASSDDEIRRELGADACDDLVGHFSGYAWFAPKPFPEHRKAASLPLAPTTGEVADRIRADAALNRGFSPLSRIYNTTTIVREGSRIGRNDSCPCGSGRKHKKCCMDEARAG